MNHPTIHIDEAPKGIWITLENDIRVRFQDDGTSTVKLEISNERPAQPAGRMQEEVYPRQDKHKESSSPDLPSEATPSPQSIPESSFWLG